MCKHTFTKIKKDCLIREGQCIPVEVYQCELCKKVQVIDIENCQVISANGKFGEEAKL
jgi:hypothetical protein